MALFEPAFDAADLQVRLQAAFPHVKIHLNGAATPLDPTVAPYINVVDTDHLEMWQTTFTGAHITYDSGLLNGQLMDGPLLWYLKNVLSVSQVLLWHIGHSLHDLAPSIDTASNALTNHSIG